MIRGRPVPAILPAGPFSPAWPARAGALRRALPVAGMRRHAGRGSTASARGSASSTRRYMRLWVLLAALALAGHSDGADRGPVGGGPLRPIQVKFVCSSSLMKSVRKSDAAVSLQSWMSMIGPSHRFRVDGTVVISESFEETRRLVGEGTADILLLDTVEYLALQPTGGVAAVATFARRGEPGAVFQLIVRRDGGIRRVADLRDKAVNLSEKTAAGLGLAWLDTQLAEARLGRLESVAARVTDRGKPAAACLPVFFGTADACLVERREFETMAELNPQVNVRLEALASSPRLLESVIAMTGRFQLHREEVLRAMFTLHTDPLARQMITLFKMEQVVPFQEEMLRSVRALKARAYQPAQARTVDGDGGKR